MKKNLLLFIGCLLAVHNTASAVTIKKAAPVVKQETSAQNIGANLLPTVMGLVSGIQALNQQQKTLTAECIPSSQEINFVNDTIKEWAKTGASTATISRVSKALERGAGGYKMIIGRLQK